MARKRLVKNLKGCELDYYLFRSLGASKQVLAPIDAKGYRCSLGRAVAIFSFRNGESYAMAKDDEWTVVGPYLTQKRIQFQYQDDLVIVTAPDKDGNVIKHQDTNALVAVMKCMIEQHYGRLIED